ncbi:type II toxin-antitoxin system TacA family antitoxin [Azospirillum sp. sgz301742]
MSQGKSRTSVRMQLRASPAQRRVLHRAAASSARSVNAFVLDSACAAAYQMLAGQPDFVMDDPDWEHVLGLLGRTAGEKEELRALLAGPA